MATPIHGIYETLTLFNTVVGETHDETSVIFDVDIVGSRPGVFSNAVSLPLQVHRSVSEVSHTDVVVMASMMFENETWITGRHPEVVRWLRDMHRQGADLASACAGALLLAETGLLDGCEATTHWAFAPTFRRNFPRVRLRVEELLIASGTRTELIMAGAANAWQQLILYLVARHASPGAAQALGKFLLYHWDMESQAPYLSFAPQEQHGDALVRQLQGWIQRNLAMRAPVEEMARMSGIAERSFKRRFRRATGYSPLQYVQHLRIEAAKRLIETTDAPIEGICCEVGYDEPAFFRRLFKRITRLTPSEYRRKFRSPATLHA